LVKVWRVPSTSVSLICAAVPLASVAGLGPVKGSLRRVMPEMPSEKPMPASP
jgi:hypothetical protein